MTNAIPASERRASWVLLLAASLLWTGLCTGMAIGAAYFDVIVLDRTVTKDLDDKLVQQLRTNGSYRLLAKLPYRNSSGSGYYQIWVKR